MLIACHHCHRQFDVTNLAVGSKVRCLCGQLLEVPEITPRDLEMLRCSSCGGHLGRNDKDCSFCGSTVQLGERGYGGTCPECFARMPKNAKYCTSCGVPINPVGRLQPLEDKDCPRCEAPLAIQEFDNGSITECTGCGGVWLEESVFAKATKNADATAVASYVKGRAAAGSSAAVPLQPEQKVRYLECPTCHNLMHRKNYANCSGIIIDWCKGHGYWFDRHELENIMAFIDEGGLDKAREKDRTQAEYAARRAERRRDSARMDTMTMGRGSQTFHRNRSGGSLLDALGGLINGLLF